MAANFGINILNKQFMGIASSPPTIWIQFEIAAFALSSPINSYLSVNG